MCNVKFNCVSLCLFEQQVSARAALDCSPTTLSAGQHCTCAHMFLGSITLHVYRPVANLPTRLHSNFTMLVALLDLLTDCEWYGSV